MTKFYGSVSQSNDQFPTRSVLLCAAAEIALFGWNPSTAGFDKTTGKVIPLPPGSNPPTRDNVLRHFVGPDELKQEARETLARAAKEKGLDLFSAEFQQGVDDALDWARSANEFGDYTTRIRVLAQQPYISPRDFGLAVSILPSYEKHKKVSSSSASQYVGRIDESLSVEMVVTDLTEFDDQFTQSFSATPPKRTRIVGLQVGTENVIAFYTKGSIDQLGVKVQDKLSVKGRVKAHHVYKNVNETQLNFVKFHKS